MFAQYTAKKLTIKQTKLKIPKYQMIFQAILMKKNNLLVIV